MWSIFKSQKEIDEEEREQLIKHLDSEKVKDAIVSVIMYKESRKPLKNFENKLKSVCHSILSRAQAQMDQQLDATSERLASFLRSDKGIQVITELLPDALARVAVHPVLEAAGVRLKERAEEEVANLMADAETALNGSAAAHADALKRLKKMSIEHLETSAAANLDALKRNIKESAQTVANLARQDLEDRLSAYRALIVEAVSEQLPLVLRREVARHVKAGPILESARSNKELALAHGISIREVKRRRRDGWFD